MILNLSSHRLINNSCNIKDTLDYIDKHQSKILHVPVKTACKIMELSMTLPNFVNCLHGLKALSGLVEKDAWQSEPALPAVSLIE